MDKALTERLWTRFQTLGGENDGYLTAEDFDQEVTRILQATRTAGTTPRAQLLRSAYQAYWWALLDGLDRNRDGKVSFDEYAQIVHGMDKFKSFARARADAVDRFTDLDADGWITRDDFMSVMLAARFNESAARAAFDGMDATGEGRVPAGRFTELIMEFYDTVGGAGVAQRLVPSK
jgi:Ca2+-binding EF-hand superfamily protein